VVDVGRDPTTGKRVRNWHSGFRTKREAERARIEILGRVDHGTYVVPDRRTFGTYLEREWLPAVKSRLRASTLDSYTRNIRLHISPELGHLQLQSLTSAHLNCFYAEKLEYGRLDARGGLSPKSVRHLHGVIRKSLADALRWNLVQRNVADSADPPRLRAHGADIKTWSAAELGAFLDSVSGDRLYGAWVLAATTGMRRGEILGLRWVDVYLDAATVSVRQTRVSVAYDAQASTPKTARGRRSIALDRTTVVALRAHRKEQLEERVLYGGSYVDSGFVFTDPSGKPIHPDRLTKLFDKHVKDSGLPRIRLHDLRHTHATLALAAGIQAKVVSERLGHATVAFTLDIYAHVVPALQQDAADKIAALIFDL